jgi:uncharacterized delta-60 repeat protein
MKKIAPFLICLLALVASPQAGAKPKAGRLDTSFGKGGKTMVAFPAENAGGVGVKYEIPFQFTPGHLEMAQAPDGKIVIAGSTQLVRLLANGKLDPSFGNGGVVAIARPSAQSFVLAGVAVDSEGRVLVAGSARPIPAESTPDPLISSAMVRRYAADGSIDTSFGDQGTVITNLGILPPRIGNVRYQGASVGLNGIVVDSLDRPVLTGASVSEVVPCSGAERSVSTGFVARVTASGAPDPGFGEKGLRQIVDFGSFRQGHLFPGGNLLVIGSGKFSCPNGVTPRNVLTSFETAGNLDGGFGFSGFRSIGMSSAPVLGMAPSGKILLLGRKRNAGKGKARQLVMRLLPDGSIDSGFGRDGRIGVLMPRTTGFAAIAADNKERVLLAGRILHKLPRPGPLRSTFWLARMKPKGRVDRSFGPRDGFQTGFGGPSSSYATQILVRGNRILVGGLVSTPRLPTGGGYAIARYLGGR